MNKNELLSKKSESHCPKCYAGLDDIEWGVADFNEVKCQTGICKKCGCEFTEYYNYSDTEWNGTKKDLKEITGVVVIPIGDKRVIVELKGQDGKGNWLAGVVDSDLKEDAKGSFAYSKMIDAIESLILAMALKNIPIENSAFESAVLDALEACANHAD